MNGMNEKEKIEFFKNRIYEAMDKRNDALSGEGIMCLSLSVQQEERWRIENNIFEEVLKLFNSIFKGDK